MVIILDLREDGQRKTREYYGGDRRQQSNIEVKQNDMKQGKQQQCRGINLVVI